MQSEVGGNDGDDEEQLDPADFRIPTAKEFQRLREAAGMTQEEAATWAGMHERTVHRLESGKTQIGLGAARELLDVYRSAAQE